MEGGLVNKKGQTPWPGCVKTANGYLDLYVAIIDNANRTLAFHCQERGQTIRSSESREEGSELTFPGLIIAHGAPRFSTLERWSWQIVRPRPWTTNGAYFSDDGWPEPNHAPSDWGLCAAFRDCTAIALQTFDVAMTLLAPDPSRVG